MIYYRNYFITAICNIIIFYILFSIGIGILHIWSEPLYTFLNITSTVQQPTGCQCTPPSIHPNASNVVRIVQNNTVIKYLPPLFWDRWRRTDLANLTLRLTSMIDNYIATTATEFLSNASESVSNKTINQTRLIVLNMMTPLLTSMIDSYFTTTAGEFLANATDIITNKTINQIQTVGLDKLTVDKITTNSIDTQIITTNSIDTQIITTNSMDALSSNITSITAKNISSKLINSVDIDCADINAISVAALSLYGNTLNKCTQGKC